MIEGKIVAALEPGKVTLEPWQVDESALTPDKILVKTLFSAISAGTECAWITGNSNNEGQKFPHYPGYGAVGEVIAVGSAAENFAVGDKVILPWGGHRSHSFASAIPGRHGAAFKIEETRVPLREAALAQIGSFSMLGVRRLRIEMGEAVMIAGLGLLGEIAVQAARLSGAAPLLACDCIPERRELALAFGADAVFDPREPDFVEKVRAAAGGKGIAATVEVTGKAAALAQALRYTAKMGRITLLGCTRVADCPIDFYRDVHLPGITLIGAHTSNRPGGESRPGAWSEHDDYATILRFLATGRFDFASLIHRVVSPAECTAVYGSLLGGGTPPLGTVFDWSLL